MTQAICWLSLKARWIYIDMVVLSKEQEKIIARNCMILGPVKPTMYISEDMLYMDRLYRVQKDRDILLIAINRNLNTSSINTKCIINVNSLMDLKRVKASSPQAN